MQRIVIKLFLLSFLLVMSAFASANDEKVAVQNAYSSWCKAIGEAKGDASVVVKFYAPNAMLMPTLSGKILRNTKGGLDNYFTHLTSFPKY